jgi:hypothetical protein
MGAQPEEQTVIHSAGVQISRVAFGAALLLLTACANRPLQPAPPPREQVPAPAPPPTTSTEPADARIYVYPAQGQTPEKTARDRYECHLWAVRQSGFDPSRSSGSPAAHVVVVRDDGPTRQQAAASGALGGAVVGAAVSRPRDAAAGAVVGAVIGGVLGAATVPESAPPPPAPAPDPVAAHASDYRRALGACLEGRGYSVSK